VTTQVTPTVRKASPEDLPALHPLIADSARGLCRGDYTSVQIETALGSAWGVDTQLIADGTYFVAEAEGELVGCGGWSNRTTLFGGDQQAGRSVTRLDPKRDPARIRAFFVHPDWARHGIAHAILARCESEAQEHGFRSASLMATLSGVPFYRAHGYVGREMIESPLPDGTSIAFLAMTKDFGAR
jgi:GNAT superfamily N-acetyltransferase